MKRKIRFRHVAWFTWRYLADHTLHAFTRGGAFMLVLTGALFAGSRIASLYSGRTPETVTLAITAGLCGILLGGYAFAVLRRMRGESTAPWDIFGGLKRPLSLAAFGVIISFRFGYSESYPPQFSVAVQPSAFYLPLVLFVLILHDRESRLLTALRETFDAIFRSPTSLVSMCLILASAAAVSLVSIALGLLPFGVIASIFLHWLALPALVAMVCGAYLSYFGRRKTISRDLNGRRQ